MLVDESLADSAFGQQFAVFSPSGVPRDVNALVFLTLRPSSKCCLDLDWYRIVGDTSIPMTLAVSANLPRVPHVGSVVTGQVVPVVSTGTWEGDVLWG